MRPARLRFVCRWFVMAIAVGWISAASADEPPAGALAVFQQRIVPILKSPNPSSCAECHLSGVDLKQYIRPTQEQTFAALKQAGLVDLEHPDQSKLLAFLDRRPEKPSTVREKIRQEERAAFREWILAAVKDPSLSRAKADEKIGPQLSEAVIRHARTDRVLKSFVENVWSEVGRCAACHAPDRNQEQVKKHGEQVSWIELRDPQATLDRLVERGLLDLEKPDRSLLLLKPTAQVKHGGGVKLTVGDRTYTQFRRFIEDYAAVRRGGYAKEADLPRPAAEVSRVSEIWLKIEGLPERADKQVLRVNLYRWDEAKRDWASERCATGDRQIAGDRRLWQQHLTLTAPRESAAAKSLGQEALSLPAGKYLVRIYIDRDNNLVRKYPYDLGPNEFVAQVELDSRWPAGYGQMTVIRFPQK